MSENYCEITEKVFHYFKEICAIPHGSGDMYKIADYCMNFADKNSLKAVRDNANNVIIYKSASKGYEDSEPIILQGHLDMVCQKTNDSNIDFLTDGIDVLTDGDFIKANGTTLGADNGIAVAMVLTILQDNTIPHPPIEAVFTTDEEIGMIGAMALDFSLLSAKKMINLDAEEDESVTVSCAGGSDFNAVLPIKKETVNATKVTLTLSGLKGGHSGVEINKGRVNADVLMGRLLNHLKSVADFRIIGINGGNKGNAIPNTCSVELACTNPEEFKKTAKDYISVVKQEINARESGFEAKITVEGKNELNVLSSDTEKQLIFVLTAVPNGIIEMSAEIEGLVETSLNLGILKTEKDVICFNLALRSNKQSALKALEEKLRVFFSLTDCNITTGGHYPPWEFKNNSVLRELYVETYKKILDKEPTVEAIHAGLECGVFASNINDLDCIAIGPNLFDVHTVNEKMSISSAKRIFTLLLKILEKSR